jgi:hypothetical protein
VLDSPADLPHTGGWTGVRAGSVSSPRAEATGNHVHTQGFEQEAAGLTRFVRIAVSGAVALAASFVVGVPSASAAPNGCNNYGIGIAIIPQFVGTDDIAVTAYQGEIIDYNVSVFLKADPPGTPSPVLVCPIFGGTLTLVLPDGSGPFTLDTNISLTLGATRTYQNVPVGQKYTMNTADIIPGMVPERVAAIAHVVATSDGLDTDPRDDRAVDATASAPTFFLAPSTAITVTPNPPAIQAGQSVAWTITETNDTPPKFFPAPLTAVHVDLSTDGGATTFVSVDVTTPGLTGDANGNQLLDVDETWVWLVTTNPTANTTVTATGFGNGPRAHLITFPADAEERAAAPVQVTPPPAPPTPPVTSTPILLPPTGGGTVLDASGIIGVAIALTGIGLLLVTRRRRASES